MLKLSYMNAAKKMTRRMTRRMIPTRRRIRMMTRRMIRKMTRRMTIRITRRMTRRRRVTRWMTRIANRESAWPIVKVKHTWVGSCWDIQGRGYSGEGLLGYSGEGLLGYSAPLGSTLNFSHYEEGCTYSAVVTATVLQDSWFFCLDVPDVSKVRSRPG